MQISSKPVVFDAHLKRRTNTFHVPFYSVYMLVSEVKLSQTFIQRQVQEIFTTIIFKISLPGAITLMYKLDQVCTDDAQKTYLW